MGELSILIGDDNSSILEALGSMLGASHRIVVASGGTELIKLFRLGQFDAVILDVVFPSDVSGIQIAKRMRSIDPRIPILMMSALPQSDDIRSQISGLGAAFCEKPIRSERVFEFIRGVLNERDQ